MMNKKNDFRFMTGVLISLIFIVAGCGVGPGTGVKVKDFHVGDQGINILFFKSNLKEVFETDEVGRSLYIQNKGAYSINGTQHAVLSVSYDEYYLTLEPESPTGQSITIPNEQSQQMSFSGKGLNNPLGDEDYYEYLFKIAPLNALRDTVKTTITYQLCYPYQTEVTIATCIDTRKYTQDQSTPVCKQTTYSSSSGQGGPMAITKIVPEISMSGNVTRPQFSIYVANKGNGYLINNTGDDVCSPENIAKRAGNLGTVKVGALLSGRQLTCSPAELRLKSGDNFVRCFVSEADLELYKSTTRNYVAPLTVTLDYGYVDIEKEEITIKRLYDLQPNLEAKSCGYYEYLNSTGGCVSLCDYCKYQNPPYPQICAERLDQNNLSYFRFDEEFTCSCSKGTCLTLRPDGQCVFGFCSGSNYCCNTNECRGKADNSTCGDHNVCRNNKCTNITMCEVQWGSQNRSCMNIGSCNETTIVRGLCPPNSDPNIVCCHTQG